jgi:fructose-bisphosphate aldolase, class I
MNELETVARALMAPGKGTLAADESTGSIEKRFEAVGVESTPETRRAFRELLFTTRGIEEFISGVILFDETIRQATGNGTPFARVLADRGIIPGIKVDSGTRPLALAPGETITEGRSAASVGRCPRRFPGSCSCRGVRAKSAQLPTSTP